MIPQTAQEQRRPGSQDPVLGSDGSRRRTRLIAQYRDGYAAIAEALLKITPEELDARAGAEPLDGARSCTTSPTAKRPRRSGSGGCWLRTTRRFRATTRKESHAPCIRAVRHARRSSCSAMRGCDRRAARCLQPADGCAKVPTARAAATPSETWLRISREHANRHARQNPRGAGRGKEVSVPRSVVPLSALIHKYRSRVRLKASSSSSPRRHQLRHLAAGRRSTCAGDPDPNRMSIVHLSGSYS